MLPTPKNSSFTTFGISLGYSLNWIAVISHLLANPVDFLWSLCLKLDDGRRIKIRCYKLHSLSDLEKKDLSAVCFALEDFEGGVHVKTLLSPLEGQSSRIKNVHHVALQGILAEAARDLADARQHNKLHSTLAILIYGKEVSKLSSP